MDNQEGGIISDRKWEQYATRMFPYEPVKGKLLKILRMELQSGFAFQKHTMTRILMDVMTKIVMVL